MKKILLILSVCALFVLPSCDQQDDIVPEIPEQTNDPSEDDDDDVNGPKTGG